MKNTIYTTWSIFPRACKFTLNSYEIKQIASRYPTRTRSDLSVTTHTLKLCRFYINTFRILTALPKTPGCSLKPPKIESSASCLCSHLPRPHFLSSPQIQRPAQLPPVCHIIYFCNCSLLGLESLSHPLGQS